MELTHGPAGETIGGEAAVLAGGGEMGALTRAFDWAATPVGPPASWPTALRTVVGILLAARQPMLLWWGPELVQFYNDAYRRSLGGDRHPAALGAEGREFWADAWHIVGPEVEGILAGGSATWHEDHLVPIVRDGRLEDVYWTYGYTPVRDDAGAVAGVLATVIETTAEVRVRDARALERERLLAESERARARAEALAERLRTSEVRVRAVIEQAPVAVAVMEGPEHVYTLVSPSYAAILGHRPLRGRSVREAVPELEGQEFYALIDRAYETGEPVFLSERHARLDRDGDGVLEDYFFNIRYAPLRDASGAVYAVASAAIDVTEQVRARREVEAARAVAEAANRAKSEFLAVMSHELRTPLNAIGGYAELMEMGIRGPLTEQQREDLRRIQRSQQHLLGLINEVLNYARLETGAVRYDLADVCARDALAEAEGLVAPQVRAKGLTLTAGACAPEISVRADPEKLRQVLVNLLSNAVKFTDAGGRIEVGCEAAGGAGEPARTRIWVRDTGRGIPPDKLEAIFEPFVQVDKRLTRTSEGVGLGLSISRDLARGMHGELTAHSAPGEGSTFSLELPRPG